MWTYLPRYLIFMLYCPSRYDTDPWMYRWECVDDSPDDLAWRARWEA